MQELSKIAELMKMDLLYFEKTPFNLDKLVTGIKN